MSKHRLRALLVSLVLAIVVVMGGSTLRDMPEPSLLVQKSSVATTKIYDRHGSLIFEVLDPRTGRRSPAKLAQLPDHLPNAVIAIEDAGYHRHRGVEPRALMRATWQAVRNRRIVSGGSTIPMQLARAVLMSPEERAQRSLVRKAREIVLAQAITRRFSKAQVLELYLNEVYFGQLAYGVEAAAQVFFGKPAHALDLAESAMLAGQIQAPAHTNPFVDIDAARARQHVVLAKMAQLGLISEEEARLAAAEPLQLAGGNVPLAAPHFTSYVLGQLERDLGRERLVAGGLHVVTSLDMALQALAEDSISAHLGALGTREPDRPDYEVGDAALVAIDPRSGEILAMVGSADYFDGSIDGAVNVALARRQPGSALKPLVYASAFDAERWGPARATSGLDDHPPLPFTAATVLSDVPTSFLTAEGEPYRPLNYDRNWHGPISLRRALATSSNLVAVKVLQRVGIDSVLDTAEAMGIRSLIDRERYGLSLALGGGEVRLLELTGAYAVLADGGRHAPAVAVLGVLEEEEYQRARADLAAWREAKRPPRGAPVLDERVAWLISDILADDRARLPAFGESSPLAIGRPAAAKTGTTTQFRDNWTLGYTPQIAAGVWVGNADGSPMRHISGITGAAPIWHAFMVGAHRGKPVRGFPRPGGMVEREVCAASGLAPTPRCSLRRIEHFLRGTEALAPDDSHVAIGIDAATGGLWTEGCRGPRIERVLRLFAPEAEGWALGEGRPSPPRTDCHGRAAVVGRDGNAAASRIADGRPGTQDPEAARPAIQIVRPAEGAVFALAAGLPLTAQKTPLELRIFEKAALDSVSLTIDGRPVATLLRPPWRFDWTLEAGEHVARAEARTVDGRRMRSPPLHFSVLASDVQARAQP